MPSPGQSMVSQGTQPPIQTGRHEKLGHDGVEILPFPEECQPGKHMYSQRNTQIPHDSTFRWGTSQHSCLSPAQLSSAQGRVLPAAAPLRSGGGEGGVQFMSFLVSHVALSRLESRAPRVALPLPMVCGQPQPLTENPAMSLGRSRCLCRGGCPKWAVPELQAQESSVGKSKQGAREGFLCRGR